MYCWQGQARCHRTTWENEHDESSLQTKTIQGPWSFITSAAISRTSVDMPVSPAISSTSVLDIGLRWWTSGPSCHYCTVVGSISKSIVEETNLREYLLSYKQFGACIAKKSWRKCNRFMCVPMWDPFTKTFIIRSGENPIVRCAFLKKGGTRIRGKRNNLVTCGFHSTIWLP